MYSNKTAARCNSVCVRKIRMDQSGQNHMLQQPFQAVLQVICYGLQGIQKTKECGSSFFGTFVDAGIFQYFYKYPADLLL